MGLAPSVQPVTNLLRSATTTQYSHKPSTTHRCTLDAAAIDEPKNNQVVAMLDALSPEEAAYYRH